jgi:superfamily II DNA helicase RecQ
VIDEYHMILESTDQ